MVLSPLSLGGASRIPRPPLLAGQCQVPRPAPLKVSLEPDAGGAVERTCYQPVLVSLCLSRWAGAAWSSARASACVGTGVGASVGTGSARASARAPVWSSAWARRGRRRGRRCRCGGVIGGVSMVALCSTAAQNSVAQRGSRLSAETGLLQLMYCCVCASGVPAAGHCGSSTPAGPVAVTALGSPLVMKPM